MWYGKDTPRLIEVKKAYEEIFGYNPDGELGIEYTALERRKYIHDIEECLRKGIHIAELYSYDEDE